MAESRIARLLRQARVELDSCRLRNTDNPSIKKAVNLSAPRRTWDRRCSGAGVCHGK